MSVVIDRLDKLYFIYNIKKQDLKENLKLDKDYK